MSWAIVAAAVALASGCANTGALRRSAHHESGVLRGQMDELDRATSEREVLEADSALVSCQLAFLTKDTPDDTPDLATQRAECAPRLARFVDLLKKEEDLKSKITRWAAWLAVNAPHPERLEYQHVQADHERAQRLDQELARLKGDPKYGHCWANQVMTASLGEDAGKFGQAANECQAFLRARTEAIAWTSQQERAARASARARLGGARDEALQADAQDAARRQATGAAIAAGLNSYGQSLQRQAAQPSPAPASYASPVYTPPQRMECKPNTMGTALNCQAR